SGGSSGRDEDPQAALARLARLPGEVAYAAVDIGDAAQLERAVTNQARRWGTRPLGVFHLAGVYHESPVLDETVEALSAMLRPRVPGGLNLHRLLAAQGGGLFVSSSSVAGHFGGANVAAYAAANSALDAFAAACNGRDGVDHYSFGWSTWSGIGQSR